MIIDYVVNRVEVLDPAQIRVVVQISIPRVVNGYGGGAITITVPLAEYRAAIEALVIRKFTNETAPQQHELVLNGDCTKVEQLMEDLGLFAVQSRGNTTHDSDQSAPKEGETEGRAEQPAEVEVPVREESRDEAAQDIAAASDDASQADLPSVTEESPKE